MGTEIWPSTQNYSASDNFVNWLSCKYLHNCSSYQHRLFSCVQNWKIDNYDFVFRTVKLTTMNFCTCWPSSDLELYKLDKVHESSLKKNVHTFYVPKSQFLYFQFIHEVSWWWVATVLKVSSQSYWTHCSIENL